MPVRKVSGGRKRGPDPKPIAERLAAKTTKSDGCWTVSGYKTGRNGYVQFQVDPSTKSRDYAHRIAYALANGPVPAGKVVRHTCDNPICVNPAHLVLGTQLDNIHDSMTRGRFQQWRSTGVRLNGTAVSHRRRGVQLVPKDKGRQPEARPARLDVCDGGDESVVRVHAGSVR